MTNEQMDALIAEKVMGMCKHDYEVQWKVQDCFRIVSHGICRKCAERLEVPLGHCNDEYHAWHPSTDLNHAFEALEKWLNDNPRMEFHSFTHSDVRPIMYEASLFCGESMVDFAEVDNESLATAICLALLQAVGVEA